MGSSKQPRQTPVPGPIKTVSEVNREARTLIEERFRLLWMEGEVSNFRPYASGHWYFSLKDQRAQIRCVMFANRNRQVRLSIANGMSVVVRGVLSIFEARGDFQVLVEHIEPVGEGAARAALEALRKRLADEGLFAAERKRSLPAFPRHAAVISSLAGAALRDILAVIQRRFPCLAVTCIDVTVQGAQAEARLLGAVDHAERLSPQADVIIIARGGGSLEDMAAFNLESVARRIAAAKIPVVSAIGHEIDFTLADFVADQRAPTPSAAAELVTPDGAELIERLARLEAALASRLSARMRVDQRLLAAARGRLVHPAQALAGHMRRAKELGSRLTAATLTGLGRARIAVAHQAQLLRRASPQTAIDLARNRVINAGAQLDAAAAANHQRAAAQFANVARALGAVSPLATLERGYAIVAKPDGSRWGRPIGTVDVVVGDVIVAHLADGRLRARVEDVAKSAEDD